MATNPFQQMTQGIDGNIVSYGSALLGRDLSQDPAGYSYWQDQANNYGLPGMYRELQATPEAANYALGQIPRSADASWGQGRQAVANINSGPFVFSNYTMPGLAHGDNFMRALAPGFQPQGSADGSVDPGSAAAVLPTYGPRDKFKDDHEAIFKQLQEFDWSTDDMKQLSPRYNQLRRLQDTYPDSRRVADLTYNLPENQRLDHLMMVRRQNDERQFA